MKNWKLAGAVALIVFAGAVSADHKHPGKKRHAYAPQYDVFEYARVIDAEPLYREVKVSTPVRECHQVPVYHTQQQHKSAGGMLAGGLIGGIIGHQFGKGRGNKVATAVGTLVGAHIGHEAVNGHVSEAPTEVVEYREHCETHQRVSYEQVVDGYDVTYKFRGKRYHVQMPYHPGKRIKMRVQYSPVI